MAGREKQASQQLNPLAWMVTFSDLITLLLTFFVLLISMSSMDVKAIQQSFGMFSGSMGALNYSDSGRMKAISQIIERIQETPVLEPLVEEDLKELLFDFQDVGYQQLMDLVDRDITIIKDERGLVIQLADYILFHEGGAVLRREFTPILSRIADVLRAVRQPVSVEGHTDASLLEGGRAAWAWELSLDRAIAVMKFFTEEESLLPERFRVGGFGPSRPLAPNDTPKNRAKNRRIEIILYKETV